MTWEIAVNVGLIGTAFILLLIAFFNRDDQEKYFPLKMIFITLALLFAVSSLRTNSLIVQANNATINNSALVGNLTSIADQGYIVMNWVFYLFLLITAISFLAVVVKYLTDKSKGSKLNQYNK